MAIIMSIAGVLPVELMENIFLRLEVKPLISLTDICKSWLAFIYSPSFIKAHLSSHSLNPKNQQMLLYKFFDDTIKLCPLNFTATLPISTVRIPVYFQRRTPSVNKQIICRPRISPSVSFVGSVNGLVCLSIISKVRKYSVIIWNPATHRFKKIFDPDQTLCNIENIYLSFVFDTVVGDYKVLFLYLFWRKKSGKKRPYRFRMYSCNDHVWKELNTDFTVHLGSLRGCVTVRGNVYWMGRENVDQVVDEVKYVWVSFDVGTEAIRVFPGPENPCNIDYATAVINLGDNVGQVVYTYGTETYCTIDVYVLDQNSFLWTKAYSIDADTRMTLNLHCSVNDKFVMKSPRGRMFVYDIISKKIMDLGIGEGMHYEPMNYAESLVAIEGMKSVRVKSAKRDKRLEYVQVTDVRRIENR